MDTEDHSSAFAQKSASYDEDTGTFTYTIVVKAEGNPTNVNVKDVISGNVLIFNNDVQITGNSSTYTSNQMPTGQKGFDYTFASMQDGEEITITYSAKLDPNEIPSDGKITTDMTRNTVTVTPDDGEPHNSSYSHEINLKKPEKSTGTEVGTTADGKKIYSWRIDYNSTAIANAAGDTITDKIGESSQQYMKYYEDVTVKVYNKSD